jgi:transcriptional regulator with XRE-family HTH domain
MRPRSKPRAQDIKGPFGDRVTELRRACGMTQGELARAAGISKVYLGTVERAEKGASIETIEKLARGLGVTIADLFVAEPREAQRPAERLARKVVALARHAPASRVERFERIAAVYFEPDEREPGKQRGPRQRGR